MNLYLVFRSCSFPPTQGEDDLLINEGTHGKALIEWLTVELKKQEVSVDDGIVEDFGWFAYFQRGPVSGGIACTIHPEGKWHECHISVDMNVGLLMRLFHRDEAKQLLAETESTITGIIQRHSDTHDLLIEKK